MNRPGRLAVRMAGCHHLATPPPPPGGGVVLYARRNIPVYIAVTVEWYVFP
jgi:hypothetical protein